MRIGESARNQHFLLFLQSFQVFYGSILSFELLNLDQVIIWFWVKGVEHNPNFNLFQNKPWFLNVCDTSLLKTRWEKEKLLVTYNLSFSHRVFYLFGELSAIFIKSEFVLCKLFQFGTV